MGLPEPVQIQVVALKPVSCGAFAWRRGGALTATVVVKATFGLVPDGPARLVAPLPLVAEDTYSSASGSLVEPADLAPYLPCAGVVLWAHARAPHPVPAMTVRLALFRGETRLIDKSLHVFGDRARGAAPQPVPFQDMPIVYERTYGGSGFPDNPAGTGATADARALPNVLHPANPKAPAGFGPVSRHWAPRRRLAGALDPVMLDRPGADLPDALDYRYFHAAPADQQCEFLLGDEWIVMDGMHPTLPRLSARLPSARAQARWVSLAGSHPAEPRSMSLAADTLLVDVERRLCSLVWRGCIALDPADAAAGMVVYTGVEVPGYPIVWPEGVPALQVPAAHAVEIQDAPAVQHARLNQTQGGDVTAPYSAEVAAARAALSALPFKKSASSDPAPRFAALPPSRPSTGLGTTAPAGAVSPFASGLPFKTAGHAPPPPPSSPGLPPPPVPPPPPSIPAAPPSQPAHAARSAWDDEEEGHTRMLSADALEAQRRAWTAPFALAEPGAKAPASAPSLPGAPWSAEIAAPVTAAEPEMETLVTSVEQLAAAASARAAKAAAPPVVAPDPEVAPPPLVAPPLLQLASHLSAASPEPIAVEAPPASSTQAAPAAPADAPPASAPAPATAPAHPAAPVEPDASSSLRATVEARLAAREPLLDLDLAGADLQDLDLTGASLGRANLSGTRLARCKLAGARLAGAQLVGADLTGADLEGADLGHADLSRATLAQARLDGALLEQANLSGAQGQGASFRRAKAARASFARGQWDEASFAGADAPHADFTAASLARAHFEGATLAEARFADACGPGAVFDEARLGQARLVGAAFQGASFRSADARGSVWEKATLDEASFAGGILASANLSRASCARASFAGADLAGANLQRVVGDGADLSETRLDGADLRQARLQDANFDGARLSNLGGGKADFSRARFVRADLTGANLRGAHLAGASLAHANLASADLRDADLEGANLFGASRDTAKLGNARGFVEVDPDKT